MNQQSDENFWMKVGAECWVENHGETLNMNYDPKQEAFFAGKVVLLKQSSLKVQYIGSGVAVDDILMKYVLQRDGNPALTGTLNNLADIAVLNEAELLRQLKARFMQSKIFAAVGDALLITNPYGPVPALFTSSVMRMYQDVQLNYNDYDQNISNLPPHIYGVASNAFRDIFEGQGNQSIVISGESGSGKTENTKYALNVLTSLSGSMRHGRSSQRSLEDQIQRCNPILESFGNAMTIRNDNSSRFGKLVTLLIGSTKQIEAAQFQSYLLEKSRVTSQTREERNFHIFYALLKGLSDKEVFHYKQNKLDALGLKAYNQKLDTTLFNYLSANHKPYIASIDDAQWWENINSSFLALSFTAQEIQTTTCFLASMLHIGNIDFDESTLTNDHPCSMEPPKLCNKIASLLSVDQQQFEKSLLFKTRNISTTTVIDSPLNRADCIAQRDSIAREMYDCLFQWLIGQSLSMLSSQTKKHQLQILDIFGFEVLTHNSFEQMCINFANEKLQQLFISTIFKRDQAELKLEGLTEHINQISFVDNQKIIDLLEGYPMGIFYLLDENSQIAGTDQTMASKIRSQYTQHPYFMAPPLSKTTFVIKHTPRNVEYDTIGFKAKNKDEVGPNIIKTILSSKNTVAVDIFNSKHQDDGEAKTTNRSKTLGAKFRQSIKDLIDQLQRSQLSFVRCLKPNEFKSKDAFIDIYVLQQIRYLGIADSIRVRKEGFPYRKTYMDFYKRYGEMDNQKFSYPKLILMNANIQQIVKDMNIWKQLKVGHKSSGYLFGSTIIFMRLAIRDQIEQQYLVAIQLKHVMAKKIQKAYFYHSRIEQFRRGRRGVVQIQRLFRVRKQYTLFKLKRRNVRIIQRWWRYLINEWARRYIRKRSMVIQTCIKGVACLKAFINTRDSLHLIQGFTRNKIRLIQHRKKIQFKLFFQRSIFDKFWQLIRRRAAVSIQRHVRGLLVRCKYRKRVVHLVTFKRNFKKLKSLVQVQRVCRGFLVRRRMARMKRAALVIQGYMRSCWLRQLFIRIRMAIILIQRAFRNHQGVSGDQKRLLKQYLQENEPSMERYKAQEREHFVLMQKNFCRTVFPLTKQNKTWVYPLPISIEVTTDLSEVYQGSLTKTIFDFLTQRSSEGTTVMDIQCGDAHMLSSCSNHNMYSWGLNDYYQLGKITRVNGNLQGFPHIKTEHVVITSGTRIKSISTGGNHNFCLNYNNELFAFGKNSDGDIGLPHLNNLPQATQISLGGVKNIYTHSVSRASQSVVITVSGVVYYNQDRNNEPNRLQQLPIKTQISQASLGINFAMLLSTTGIVYATRNAPVPESQRNGEIHEIHSKYFHGEKITQIECGQRHVITCTSLGKVFTWGWGIKGQLGAGNLKSNDTPILVQMPKWTKSLQIKAGMTCSVVLTDAKKVYWWGTNAIIKMCNQPTAVALEQLIDVNENFAIKIGSSWSRTCGIIYLKIADMSGINIPGLNKSKVAQQIAHKWAEFNTQQDVPYIESFSKYFQNDVMQAQHYSKEPTFRKAPIVDQIFVPHQVVQIDQSNKLQIPTFPHIIEEEEDSLLTSDQISPQKELEKEKLRHTNTKRQSMQIQSSAIQSLQFSPPHQIHTTQLTSSRQSMQADQLTKLKYHNEFLDPLTQQVPIKSQLSHRPSRSSISQKSIYHKQRSKTPKKLIFEQNGDSQEYPTNTLNLDLLERLQRKMTSMKMKMECILKIPKTQWTQAEQQFMQSMQDEQIRSQLQKLT